MSSYSVLMSVYNKTLVDELKQSIDSMLNQTVLCNQFVLVEDGPININLESLIEDYSKKNEGLFTVVKLKNNSGLGIALDAGLAECNNELVARMDSDDISLPDRCEKLLNLFENNPKLALAGTNIDEFYDSPDNVVSSRVVPSDYENIVKFIKRRDPFNHPTVMFKKSEVIRCGGYGAVRWRQDFNLFSRMINMGCYALNIDESLLLFRSNEDNYKRRKSWGYCKSYIEVVKENYKRGYCSLWDLIFVTMGQMIMFIMPLCLMKFLSDKLLRKKKNK